MSPPPAIPYGTNLTGRDKWVVLWLIPISGCTAGTAEVADLGFANDGEKIFAPGLSLNSYGETQLKFREDLCCRREVIDTWSLSI